MSVTLHTNLGDLKLELHCEDTPRAALNFLALAASGTYDGTAFHRNMRGFMVQGGDPTGTGKGGASIWGGAFADEIVPQLRHHKRGVVSMANSGKDVRARARWASACERARLRPEARAMDVRTLGAAP